MFDPVPWPIVWTAALVWLGVAFRRGFDMTSQQRRRASAVWYFVSVIPLAGVALWWAVMSNPAPTTKWVMLGVAGAVFGAAAFIAAGELISPTEGAMAQGNPPPSPPPTNGSPPTVNQGPGSAYSVDQRGGITAGTLNIGQPERRVTVGMRAAMVAELRKVPGVIVLGKIGGDSEAARLADDFNSVFSEAGWKVEVQAAWSIFGAQALQLTARRDRPQIAAALTDAFSAAGIPGKPILTDTAHFGNADGDAVLVVGVR